MANHSKPTEPRQPNQSAYIGLYGHFGRTQFGGWYDVWYFEPNEAVVQIEGRTYRFDTNVPYQFVAR
jgi:hypothetical protein